MNEQTTRANGNGGLVVGEAVLRERVGRLVEVERPRYRRLWTYYRNPMRVCAVSSASGGSATERPYRQGQEWGLPGRITGCRGGQGLDAVGRKEVVIENDIAWRVEAMVDYLFGKPVVIESAAGDAGRREEITELLRMVLGRNGGILFLQQIALIGAVYGFVDVVVKVCGEGSGDRGQKKKPTAALVGCRVWGSRRREVRMGRGDRREEWGLRRRRIKVRRPAGVRGARGRSANLRRVWTNHRSRARV